jgi:hypothetical protein
LLLHLQESPRVKMHPFTEPGPFSHASAHLFVRHDIDTAACMRNMPLLLEIDRELGVRAAVFLRADEEEYRLDGHRQAIQVYRDAGLEIGLHTLCYLEDDYLSALKRETRHFTHALGFSPASFTTHGMGSFRLEVRQRFYQEIHGRLGEFGYTFTDCCARLRAYDYTIHDSYWDDKRGSRFIYDDFLACRPLLLRGRDYLLLTHPGYWTPAG